MREREMLYLGTAFAIAAANNTWCENYLSESTLF